MHVGQREVEAAAQRGRVMPAVRTKFQVAALLVREERARVRADETSTEAHRTEQPKRLDGLVSLIRRHAAAGKACLLASHDAALLGHLNARTVAIG